MSTEVEPVPQQSQSEEEEGKEETALISATEDDGRIFRIGELTCSVVLLAASFVVEFAAMPYHVRTIPVQVINDSIHIRNLLFDEEELEDSVGDTALALGGLVLPLFLQLAMATFCTPQRRPLDRYNTFCSYCVAIALTFLVVDVVKLYCGYLRPHFYDVCQPDDNYEVCTNEDESDLRGARDSFPSGHAGLSISGLGSFSMYLHRRFGVGRLPLAKANTREHHIARLWSFLAVLPVLLALYMGTSRIHDNYHHPADVVGGFAIGGVCAYFCHHLWFLE